MLIRAACTRNIECLHDQYELFEYNLCCAKIAFYFDLYAFVFIFFKKYLDLASVHVFLATNDACFITQNRTDDGIQSFNKMLKGKFGANTSETFDQEKASFFYDKRECLKRGKCPTLIRGMCPPLNERTVTSEMSTNVLSGIMDSVTP